MAIKLDLLEVENIYNKDGEQTLNLTGDQGIVVSGPSTFAGDVTFQGGEAAINVNGSGNQDIRVGSTSGGFARIYLDGKNGDFSGSDYIYIGQDDDGAVHFNAGSNAGTTVFTSKGTTNLTMDGATSTFAGTVSIVGTNSTNQESVLLRGITANGGDLLGSIRTANTGGYNQEMRFYTSNADGTSDEDLTLTLKPDQSATFAGTIGSGAITSTGKITGTELEGTSLDINGTVDFDQNLNAGAFVDHKNSNAGTSAYTSIRIQSNTGNAEIWRNSSTRTQTGGAAQSLNIYNTQDTNLWSGGTRALHLDTSQNATFAGGISMSDSILINYTGSDGQAIDAGVKVMNDASDWGMYVRKHSNANYGIRIDSGGTDAFNIYSTTGGSTKTFNVNGGTGNTTIAGTISSGAITSTGNIQTTGDMVIGAELMHNGDTDTKLRFDTDQITLYTAGASRLIISNTQSFFSGKVKAHRFFNNFDGIPTNNLGAPSLSEMALFEGQMRPQTTLANNYDNLDDLKIFTRASGSGESDFAEVTSYSDDQKRRFMRTYNSSVVIPYGHNAFRVEFVAPGYVYANLMYAYWSSQGHSTQVHIWKRRCDNNTWYQHTSSTTTISSWPGHMYLPFSTIPWHETNTTSSSHFNKIRIEFIPSWNSSYSSNNIMLSGLQVWGGYPSGKRTVHTYDHNGKIDLFKDLGLPDGGIATFGNGDDLKIYHDGSNSYIEDNGSGNLKIRTNSLNVMNQANSENMLSASQDAAVTLYYNGSEKFKTTNTGVDVTGGISVGGHAVNDILIAGDTFANDDSHLMTAAAVEDKILSYGYGTGGGSGDVTLAGAQTFTGAKTFGAATQFNNTVTVGADDTGHDVFFYGATSGKYLKWDESADCLFFPDDTSVKFGNGNDARIYISSDNLHIQQDTANTDIKFLADNGSGQATAYMTIDGSDEVVRIHKPIMIPEYIVHIGDDDTHFGFSGANDFRVKAGGSDRFQVSGDVGVLGTTDFFIQQGRKLLLDGAGGHTYIEEESDSNLKFYVAGVEQLNITNGGLHFNASLTIPDYINHAGDSGTKFGFSADDTFVVRTGGAVRLTVSDTSSTFAGRVSAGGASNPTGGAKLHVADGTGAGLEVIPSTTNDKVTLLSYDRNATAYQSLNFEALDFSFLNGNATFGGTLTLSSDSSTFINLANTTSSTGKTWRFSSASNGKLFITEDGVIDAITLDHTSGNATFAGDVGVTDSGKFEAGTGNDFKFYHDGTDGYLDNYTGGINMRNFVADSQISFSVDNGSGGGNIAEYFRVDGQYEVNRFLKNARFNDNVKANFGTGDDLQIDFDGTNGQIQQTAGDLYITNSADGKDIIFQSDNGSNGVATYFYLDGGQANTNFQKDVIFADSKKALFGGSGDLQIYHDGSNSYIVDAGTGDLLNYYSNDWKVIKYGTGELSIWATSDAGVKLYYDSSLKLETASGGVNVTGAMTASADVVAFSDKKLKENIETLDGKKVLDMRGVSFTRKDTGKESSGVIAQEIQKVAPELVHDTEGTLGVAYGNLVGYLIEAVKDQQKQIDELKAIINGSSK